MSLLEIGSWKIERLRQLAAGTEMRHEDCAKNCCHVEQLWSGRATAVMFKLGLCKGAGHWAAGAARKSRLAETQGCHEI